MASLSDHYVRLLKECQDYLDPTKVFPIARVVDPNAWYHPVLIGERKTKHYHVQESTVSDRVKVSRPEFGGDARSFETEWLTNEQIFNAMYYWIEQIERPPLAGPIVDLGVMPSNAVAWANRVVQTPALNIVGDRPPSLVVLVCNPNSVVASNQLRNAKKGAHWIAVAWRLDTQEFVFFDSLAAISNRVMSVSDLLNLTLGRNSAAFRDALERITQSKVVQHAGFDSDLIKNKIYFNQVQFQRGDADQCGMYALEAVLKLANAVMAEPPVPTDVALKDVGTPEQMKALRYVRFEAPVSAIRPRPVVSATEPEPEPVVDTTPVAVSVPVIRAKLVYAPADAHGFHPLTWTVPAAPQTCPHDPSVHKAQIRELVQDLTTSKNRGASWEEIRDKMVAILQRQGCNDQAHLLGDVSVALKGFVTNPALFMWLCDRGMPIDESDVENAMSWSVWYEDSDSFTRFVAACLVAPNHDVLVKRLIREANPKLPWRKQATIIARLGLKNDDFLRLLFGTSSQPLIDNMLKSLSKEELESFVQTADVAKIYELIPAVHRNVWAMSIDKLVIRMTGDEQALFRRLRTPPVRPVEPDKKEKDRGWDGVTTVDGVVLYDANDTYAWMNGHTKTVVETQSKIMVDKIMERVTSIDITNPSRAMFTPSTWLRPSVSACSHTEEEHDAFFRMIEDRAKMRDGLSVIWLLSMFDCDQQASIMPKITSLLTAAFLDVPVAIAIFILLGLDTKGLELFAMVQGDEQWTDGLVHTVMYAYINMDVYRGYVFVRQLVTILLQKTNKLTPDYFLNYVSLVPHERWNSKEISSKNVIHKLLYLAVTVGAPTAVFELFSRCAVFRDMLVTLPFQGDWVTDRNLIGMLPLEQVFDDFLNTEEYKRVVSNINVLKRLRESLFPVVDLHDGSGMAGVYDFNQIADDFHTNSLNAVKKWAGIYNDPVDHPYWVQHIAPFNQYAYVPWNTVHGERYISHDFQPWTWAGLGEQQACTHGDTVHGTEPTHRAIIIFCNLVYDSLMESSWPGAAVDRLLYLISRFPCISTEQWNRYLPLVKDAKDSWMQRFSYNWFALSRLIVAGLRMDMRFLQILREPPTYLPPVVVFQFLQSFAHSDRYTFIALLLSESREITRLVGEYVEWETNIDFMWEDGRVPSLVAFLQQDDIPVSMERLNALLMSSVVRAVLRKYWYSEELKQWGAHRLHKERYNEVDGLLIGSI